MSDKNNHRVLKSGEDFGSIADLVSYQSGSVVSKTLMKSTGGNLTIFAFDKSEGLSEHTTPHDAFLWLLEGQASIELQGERFQLEGGDFIRLPANVPHAVQALSKMKMALAIFFDG
jgi:quercetin dioxygenase-like cupin family protein